MWKKISILTVLLLATILLSLLKGSAHIPAMELFAPDNIQILSLRFSRIILAITAGCGLAVSGIALQAILRNPLAEPYLLGTSSGAGLGALIAIVIGLSRIYLPLAAFTGAMISIIIVYHLAKEHNKISEQSLILSGVIISITCSAILVLLLSISSNETLHGLTWWLWGSLQVFNFKLLCIVIGIVFSSVTVIFIFSQDLNAISIGEQQAHHLGIETHKLKIWLLGLTALITASLVSVCGIIGFVGLIVPHMMRLIVGPNHKILIPTTCFGASIFMILCDLCARTILPPVEIPIGVITAIFGAPIFIFLLKKRQRIK
ncbi:MAG: iron ABC transporter permease [Candidatus Omnitrophota bacterium]